MQATENKPDYMFRNYDVRAYSSLSELLNDVWHDAFAEFEGRKWSTNAAADAATRRQDAAEHFWHYYHS